jgi:hypothetical protein
VLRRALDRRRSGASAAEGPPVPWPAEDLAADRRQEPQD